MTHLMRYKIRAAQNAAYLTALDFTIQRRENPAFPWPENPYQSWQSEESAAWREEFDDTIKRTMKPGIPEQEPQKFDFNEGAEDASGMATYKGTGK